MTTKKDKGNNKDSKAIATGKDRRRWLKTGLYTEIDIDAIDGRTRTGKTVKGLKAGLRDYVGNPTPASELLIHRIVYKTIKLSLYEASSLTMLTNEESAHYLPMSNSLRLDLRELAELAKKQPVGDLYDKWRESFFKDGKAKARKK